jgi:5-formyltetrahydrofolate cyclo-ligase
VAQHAVRVDRRATVRSWDEIRPWRRLRRAELIERRIALPQRERTEFTARIRRTIGEAFAQLKDAPIGFYWPIRGEVGLHGLVRELIAAGAWAALPVVVAPRQPLEFRAWRPGARMARGVWSIPIPAEGLVVRPGALLVPLVGFDSRGYRLGYGGGFYDRTLAALRPKPLAIGVGYELGRLATIHPQPHDIPMDALVTEAGVAHFRHRDPPPGPAPDSREPYCQFDI